MSRTMSHPRRSLRASLLLAGAPLILASGLGDSRARARAADPPTARIAGRVVARVPDASVGGRRVLLQEKGDATTGRIDRTTTTDDAGRFAFEGLPEGSANLYLDDIPANGSWTDQPALGVRLNAGATASVEIPLVVGVDVTGLVTDGAGQPLPAREMAVLNDDLAGVKGPIRKTMTDLAGRYHFRLTPGPASLAAYAEPGDMATELRQDVTIPAGPAVANLDPIMLDTGVILAGRIVDATGEPLAGARLVAAGSVRTFPLPDFASTATDPAGHFELRNKVVLGRQIPVDESVLFHVFLADGRKYEVALVPSRPPVSTTIKLPAFGAGGPAGPDQVAPDEIAGLVVDAQGQPIEGVRTDPRGWASSLKGVQTDAAGRFRMEGTLRPAREFRFEKEGYAPVQFFDLAPGRAGFVVVLDDRTAFEGRVLAPDGTPVPRATIDADGGSRMLEGHERSSRFWVRSDPDGRYRIHLAAGMYEFRVRVPGVGVLRLPRQVLAADEVRPLDLQLEPGITLRARVVDAGDGSPVGGFTLEDFHYRGLGGTADAEGRIEIDDMLPGLMEFRSVEAKGYARWWSADASPKYQVSKPPNELTTGGSLEFPIERGMARVTIQAERAVIIRGRVLDPDGKPRAGALVTLGRTRSGDFFFGAVDFHSTTLDDGSYLLQLPAGNDDAYCLVAHDGPLRQNRTWADATSPLIETKPGQVIDNLDLRLTRPASIEGRVVDSQGRPVANQEISASALIFTSAGSIGATIRTRPDGTFSIPFLNAGEYHILLRLASYRSLPRGTKINQVVQLTEGETKTGIVLTTPPDR